MKARTISYARAILEATEQALAADENVFVMGLGCSDPKGIFGTTLGLAEKFGTTRVFDTPVSENALTGIAVGAATMGMRPILTHQRLDFALLSLDQIINNAAKWHYMFGGLHRAPIVIRMVLGRGWGQGPQHSQQLHSVFAHIPGLKVVMPVSPADAKGLLTSAIEDDSPVIFLEHRWLHSVVGEVPEDRYRVPIGKARLVKSGKDLTIVAVSHMVLEAFRVLEVAKAAGFEADLIDLRTVKPWDKEMVRASVEKTGRLLVLDTGHLTAGFSAEISAWVSENCFKSLTCAPMRIALPDFPAPTSPALSKEFYPRASDILKRISKELWGRSWDLSKQLEELARVESLVPADVPDMGFTGPF